MSIHRNSLSESMARRSPGKLGYARWLTVGNRILRRYVSEIDPSSNLILLARFVIEVYARSWFAIQSKSSFSEAPIHIFNMIRYVADINDERVTRVCHIVIQHNAFSLHSENMLYAILCDTRPNVRLLAVRRILDLRLTKSADEFRKFVKPIINFEADEYYLLINDHNWIESTLTSNFNSSYMSSLTHQASFAPFTFPRYPCHTQSVERHIRLVSETSGMIACPKMRDGRISITLTEREIMPNFCSKKDFMF